MPLGFNIRHSNRSQQALDNSQAQAQAQAQVQRGDPINPTAAATVAGDEDKAYEASRNQPQSYANLHNELYTYVPADDTQGGDSRVYLDSADRPSRSQSHRLTTSYPPIQPPSSLGDPRRTVDDQVLGDYGQTYNTSPSSALSQAPVEQKKTKSSRLFGSFSSKSNRSAEQHSPSEQQSSHNNLGGLGRRISIRHRDNPPVFQSQAQNKSSDKQHQLPGWQSGQSSDSQLQSPHEADEDNSGADPYLIHQSEQAPDRFQELGHDQLQNPTIRLAPGDQELTVRLVDEGWQQQYQQPPQLLTQQQWLAQQNQQVSHSPVAISPVQQPNEYLQSNPQPTQYQIYPNPQHQIPQNAQSRPAKNPEVVSQLSYDSPVELGEDQRPISVQSNNQTPTPVGNYTAHQQSDYPPRITSIQGSQGSRPIGQQQSAMPPPPAPSAQTRRSTDVKQAPQSEGRNGPPPGYTQQQSFGSNQVQPSSSANPPPQAPGTQQGTNYRPSALQRDYSQVGGAAGDQGRSTPPLPGERDRDLTEMEKLVVKYKKVKGLYFDKLAQVEQLQNTLANQRLSQSRTSLDDNEYVTRFTRLDGAIKEIAFSIRKDWKTIPRWLVPWVNQDAQKTGTKEMTAVGRAAISRWIADEIFSKCFHPGLDISWSTELKRIEQNIRFFASPLTSQEEADALTSKVVQWKLSTVEGLGYMLASPESLEAKAIFTQMAVSNLTAHLLNHLQDPAPQGILGNATSIIELAVGIACHLPLESRDISITYPLPGDPVQPIFKVEALLPPLENPGPDPSADAEASSTHSDSKDQAGEADAGKGESSGQKLTKKQQDKSKNILSQLTAPNPGNGKKAPTSSAAGGESGQEKGKDRGDGSQKIRFAGFVGVEVRGRQWLINPPVWTIS